MTGGIERDEAALWRRWRDGMAEAGEPPTVEPDPMLLAAYAERRPARPGGDPDEGGDSNGVEAWIAEGSDRLADIIAARRAATAPEAPPAAPSVIARARSLIAIPDGKIVPFRPTRSTPAWRSAFAWSGIAASLAIACLMGFSIGSSDMFGLAVASQPQTLEQEFIGSQTPILDSGDLDSGI
jgi:hypothetical protein